MAALISIVALTFVGLIMSTRLSVPLLVIRNVTDSDGTVYLIDSEGRSDTVAWALRNDSTLSKAKVERFVALEDDETLIDFLRREDEKFEKFEKFKKFEKCSPVKCPGIGRSCFVERNSSVSDPDGPEKLRRELDDWAANASACKIVFSANKIKETTTAFNNAWAPMEAATFSLVSVIVVVLFLFAVIPSLMIKDADITPEADNKAE